MFQAMCSVSNLEQQIIEESWYDVYAVPSAVSCRFPVHGTFRTGSPLGAYAENYAWARRAWQENAIHVTRVSLLGTRTWHPPLITITREHKFHVVTRIAQRENAWYSDRRSFSTNRAFSGISPGYLNLVAAAASPYVPVPRNPPFI